MSLKLYLSQLVRSLPPFALAAALLVGPATAQDTLKLGLVAAMSGQSAKSGEAIVRGLSIAIDEINAKGGVLGKKVELVVRDDESNPAKGAVAARDPSKARLNEHGIPLGMGEKSRRLVARDMPA